MHTLSRSITVLFALITALTGLVACKSEKQKQEEALWHMNTPLAHDPTDDDTLAQWWSNGQHLLRLQDDHFYALYDHNNRYSRPVDRGRWDQDGYAILWLDPYSSTQPQRTRVSITKIDGQLALIMPKQQQPLRPLAGPPPAREDQLVGAWQGPMGSLRLNANMTFSLEPASGATVSGRPLAGHDGRWKLTGDDITLTPSAPNVPPTVLKVRNLPAPLADRPAASTQPAPPPTVLEGLGGELIKVKAASA